MYKVELGSKKLEQYVRRILGKSEEEDITDKDLESIETLRIDGKIFDDLVVGDLTFFKNVSNVSLNNIDIGDYEIDLINRIPNIKTLSISNANLDMHEASYHNLNLEDLILVNCDGVEISDFAQSSNLKSLTVINCRDANLKGISNFHNLEKANFANNKWMKDSDLDEVLKSEKLKELNLEGNTGLTKIEHMGIAISYADQYRPGESVAWGEKFQQERESIRDISQLSPEKIKKLKGKSVELTVDDLEYLKTPEGKKLLTEIGAKNSINISLKDTSEMDLDTLKELKESYNIDRVYVGTGWKETQDRGYSIDSYIEIKKEINKIVKDIDPNLSDAEKYLEVRNRITKKIQYDYGALELGPESADYFNSRNLENGLLNNSCVCAGYADIMKNALAEVGIDAKYVEGYTDKGELHAWNQVRLKGDDGKYYWYNDDPTWDSVNGGLDYSLMTDEEFSKTHKSILERSEDGFVYKCDAEPPRAVKVAKNGPERKFGGRTRYDD